MSKVKKTIIYICLYWRCSTKKEAQLSSFNRNPKYFQSVISKKQRENPNVEYKIVAGYKDYGISGTSYNRKDFVRMLEDAGLDVEFIDYENIPHPDKKYKNEYLKQKKLVTHVNKKKSEKRQFSEIWIKSTSRFGRNTANAEGLLEDLKKAGVTVYFIDIDKSTANPSDMDAIRTHLAKDRAFSETRSREMALYNELRGEENIVSGKLTGYEYHPVTKKRKAYYTIHPVYGPAIIRMFDLCIDYGAKETSKILFSEGYYAPQDEDYDGPPQPYPHSTIRNIWKNEKYMGVNTPNKYTTGSILLSQKFSYSVVNENYELLETEDIPMLIPPEKFYAAQEAIKKRQCRGKGNENVKGKRTPTHNFKNMLECRYCHNTFRYDNNGGSGFFKCSTKASEGASVCNCNNLYKTKLNDWIKQLCEGDLQWLIRNDFEIILTNLITVLEQYISLLENPTMYESAEIRQIKAEIENQETARENLIGMMKYVKFSEEEKEDKYQEIASIQNRINDLKEKAKQLTLLPVEIKERIDKIFECIYKEISLCDSIKKKYKPDEVLDLLDKIIVAGETVNSKGGMSPKTVLIPILKDTQHSLEVLEECKITLPTVTLINRLPDFDSTDDNSECVFDTENMLYDEIRAAQRKVKPEIHRNVRLPFLLNVIEDNSLIEEAIENNDTFAAVMGFNPDLGLEKISVMTQIKNYVEKLNNRYLSMIS